MPNQVQLIATAKQLYDGKTVCVNDKFKADEQDAEDLIAMGFAIRAPEDPKPRRSYHRRDMEAE